MHDIARDVWLGIRSARRNPGFAIATILVLGIGIGAISLMFSTYNTVVLQPLPFPEADRLVWVWETSPGGSRNSLSYDDYVDLQKGAPAFQSLGALPVFSQRRLLIGAGDPRQVVGANVSASLFGTLGVGPELGRPFIADDERRGTPGAVILSHGLWSSGYGADPGVVGRTIDLDGLAVEVRGVMPAGFDYPQGTDVWLPLQRTAGYATGRGNNNFFAVGRLREGATLAQAQAQSAAVLTGIAAAYPDTKAGWGVELESLHERYFGPAGASILLLMGIITLVPLVACANVASLFLARAIARRSEIASRLALGATRWRLVRQLLTESLVLALGGGAVGLGLAWVGGEALRRLAPAVLPRLDQIGVDAHVLAFTLGAALLTVPIFATLPALRSTDLDIAGALKAGGDRGASGRRLEGRNGLVVAQVALAVVLLVAAGLLVRGYRGLQTSDPGFRVGGLLYSRVALPRFKYDSDATINAAWDEMTSRLSGLPGVQAVGAVDRQPLSGRAPWNEVWAAQRPPATAADKEGAARRFVSDGFFEAMGIPLRAGRRLGPEDRGRGLAATVINEALARHFFPGENPVGQTLILDFSPPVPLTVVGVVGDVRERGLGLEAPPIFYLPASIAAPHEMYLVARTSGPPGVVAPAWRTTIRAVDSDIPAEPIRAIEDRVSASLFQPWFRSTLVTVFALVALLLSAIGLYGVLAYFVAAEVRQLGLRLALGATTGQVARLVLRKGLILVAWGSLVGLAGGLAAARLISSRGWLPGLDPADPVTYLLVVGSLLLAALAACAAPAARVLRIDPAAVMRAE